MYDQDGWTTVGIVVIVVVCCVVGTSLVWVIVIYHMRRKSEDYSITNTGLQLRCNCLCWGISYPLFFKSSRCLTEVIFFVFTDEINLPADIPSYLSSQGTLSEPQEGYSNSEAGSHQQLMPPFSNGFVHKSTDGESSHFFFK